MNDKNDFQLENTCKRVGEILRKLENEMKKSFSYWKAKHSPVWIDHMAKSMDIFTICLEEICGWLTALGYKCASEVTSRMFYLNKTYVNYILSGYLLLLQRTEEDKRVVIENRFEKRAVSVPKRIQEETLATQESRKLTQKLSKEGSRSFLLQKAPSSMLFGENENTSKDKPKLNPKLDSLLLTLSPHSLIERHEGILQKISDEYDESNRMVEYFLKTRRLMNHQSSNAMHSLKEVLTNLENFASRVEIDDEVTKQTELLSAEEYIKKTLDKITGAQKEVIMKTLAKYYNLKKGIMIDKSTEPDPGILKLPDLEKQLSICEKKIEYQASDLQEKNMKIEDLKYYISNMEELIAQYKERVKNLEATIEESKVEGNLYKKELFAMKKSSSSREDSFRLRDGLESLPELKRENESLRSELELLKKKHEKNSKDSGSKDKDALQEKIKRLLQLNNEKGKQLELMRAHLAEKNDVIFRYQNSLPLKDKTYISKLDNQSKSKIGIKPKNTTSSPSKREIEEREDSPSAWDPTTPPDKNVSFIQESNNNIIRSNTPLITNSPKILKTSESAYEEVPIHSRKKSLSELSKISRTASTPNQTQNTPINRNTEPSHPVKETVEETKIQPTAPELLQRKYSLDLQNKDLEIDSSRLLEKRVSKVNSDMIEEVDEDIENEGLRHLDRFLSCRKVTPKSGDRLKKIILKLLDNPEILQKQNKHHLIHSSRLSSDAENLHVVGVNRYIAPNDSSESRLFERSQSVPRILSSQKSIVITSSNRKKQLMNSTSSYFSNGMFELATADSSNQHSSILNNYFLKDGKDDQSKIRQKKKSNTTIIGSRSMINNISQDDEIRDLYDHIKKNPNGIGAYVKLLNDIMNIEKVELKPKPVEIQSIEETKKSKLREELDQILLMNSLDSFKEHFKSYSQQHTKCGDGCTHLRKFYKKIGFVSPNSNRKVMNIPVSVIKKPLFPDISGLSAK